MAGWEQQAGCGRAAPLPQGLAGRRQLRRRRPRTRLVPPPPKAPRKAQAPPGPGRWAEKEDLAPATFAAAFAAAPLLKTWTEAGL